MKEDRHCLGNLPHDIRELAVQVLGTEDLAHLWMQRPAIAFGGQRPSELVANEQGRQEVCELLLRIELGIYV